MKLNHINLVVTDVASAVQFFETCFGFKTIDIKGDYILAILSGQDHFSLVLMGSKNNDTIYPEAFHIGFMQETQEQVTDLFRALKENGIAVGQEPRQIRDSFGFYFHFQNLMIEVGTA